MVEILFKIFSFLASEGKEEEILVPLIRSKKFLFQGPFYYVS